MASGRPPLSFMAITPKGPAQLPGVPVNAMAASIQLCTFPGMLTDVPPPLLKSNLGNIEVTQLSAQFLSVSNIPDEMLPIPGRFGAEMCNELITLSRMLFA